MIEIKTAIESDAETLSELSKKTFIETFAEHNTYCRVATAPIFDVGLIFDRTKVNATMSVVEGFVKLSQGQVNYIFDIETGDTMKFDDAAELNVKRSFLVSIWWLKNIRPQEG